ncbi:MAG TPA: hypothetical protein VGE07_30600 [Herpetosiphonaceae bacterium]
MSEASITTYSKEAQRLYERGIAAARGGQRRVAAGLLTKAVQLDPRHEQAWLWLSGVLDEPHDIAFCLHSALKLNPQNAQARKGLEWIAQRNALAKAPPAQSKVRQIAIPAQPASPADEPATSWWQDWRSSLRTNSILRLATLVGLMVLIAGTAAFYRLAQAESLQALSSDAARVPLPAPGSGIVQQSALSAAEVNQAQILRYLSQVEELRSGLQAATQEYRDASSKTTQAPAQIEAARAYRDRLRLAYTALEAIEPPTVLTAYHGEYKQGIELEQSAFEAVLDYYTNYNLAVANQAALWLQEAGSHYERARAGWQAYRVQLSTAPLGGAATLR